MRTIATLLCVAASLAMLACHSDPEERNAERAKQAMQAVVTRVIVFKNQNAATAGNHARGEFGRPPMIGDVEVRLDTKANSWIVQANAVDMARVAEIAARYDQPGEPVWTKGH